MEWRESWKIGLPSGLVGAWGPEEVNAESARGMLTVETYCVKINVFRDEHTNSHPARTSLPTLVATNHAPVRHYAQIPLGGARNGGGIPGFTFPMQQQHSERRRAQGICAGITIQS